MPSTAISRSGSPSAHRLASRPIRQQRSRYRTDASTMRGLTGLVARADGAGNRPDRPYPTVEAGHVWRKAP